ncbi:MAG: sugar phosphate isomerase/epimerase family protein, partial [Tepidisphaeraceae bacterium]
MQLAVSTYSLSRWRSENGKTLEDTVDWISEQPDVRAVEFLDFAESGAPPADEQRRATALRQRAESRGLVVASYCVGAELLAPLDQQKQVVKDLKHKVDVAAELGVKTMRHDVTRGPEGGTG